MTATKFHPALFQTNMVQAIYENRKKQTRRDKGLEKCNEFPDSYMFHHFKEGFIHVSDLDTLEDFTIKCPYGNVGDVLWVRESFYKTKAVASDCPYFYKYPISKLGWDFKWKPSIHMPKEACRIFLKITDIRVERLHDISNEDAEAEGVESIPSLCTTASDPIPKERTGSFWRDYVNGGSHAFITPLLSFQSLWQSINGKVSWNLNPWVWVISFERYELTDAERELFLKKTPKRKYVTDHRTQSFSRFECTKRKCKWQGYENEKGMKSKGAFIEHVCPKCGNDEFYMLRD